MPLLPVERYLAYARALGLAPSTEEHQRVGPLPQQYADMFGWTELVDTVARAYAPLSPEERAHCGIFAQNYGEAGPSPCWGARAGCRLRCPDTTTSGCGARRLGASTR